MAKLRSMSCGRCGEMVMRSRTSPYGTVCETCKKRRKSDYRKANWKKDASRRVEPSIKCASDRKKKERRASEQDRVNSLKGEILDLNTFCKWDVNKIAKFNMNDYVARVRS